jgi:alginate O-acetyltransferase complex protein AlgI
MTFVSWQYLGLLLVTVTAYYLLPWRARIILLVLASYFFYCYAAPQFGLVLAATTTVDYCVGIAMERSGSRRRRRAWLLTSIAVNLGTLTVFKYSNMLAATLRPIARVLGADIGPFSMLMPIGISFYTFQELSYAIDVYRGRMRAVRDPFLFAAYVTFFPQLTAGPIERAEKMVSQLARLVPFDLALIQDGIALLALGGAKKLVFADRLSIYGLGIYRSETPRSKEELLAALLVMPIALYLDFSAYTDMARGSAKLFGIELQRNFNAPFLAKSPADYWNRWHISLSRWVRDYVFRPLGGFRRHQPVRTIRNVLLTMTAVGLWHGASWKFVLWGFGMGIAIAADHWLRFFWPRPMDRTSARVRGVLGRVTTIAFILGLSPLFFATDIASAEAFIERLLFLPWLAAPLPPHVVAAGALTGVFIVSHVVGAWAERVWAASSAPVKALCFVSLVYFLLIGAVPRGQQFVYVQF